MAIGNQANAGQINQNLSNIVLGLRDLFDSVDRLQTWMSTQNTATLTALGFSAADVPVLQSVLGNLETLSQIYQGKQAPAAFDYRSNSVAAWGGM